MTEHEDNVSSTASEVMRQYLLKYNEIIAPLQAATIDSVPSVEDLDKLSSRVKDFDAEVMEKLKECAEMKTLDQLHQDAEIKVKKLMPWAKLQRLMEKDGSEEKLEAFLDKVNANGWKLLEAAADV